MKRIAITPEAIHPAEPEAICAILDHGWDMVHLRHPGADIKSLRYLLDRIPAALHTRIRLHSCFELTGEYQLGGIHLNSRNPQPPPDTPDAEAGHAMLSANFSNAQGLTT